MRSEISVLGLGYMGLPFACLLAVAGKRVTGIDIDEQKVNSLKKGESPFHEEGLSELLEKAIASGNLAFENKLKKSTDIYIIAVPTPEKNHAADLSFVVRAAEMISEVFESNSLVILESTVTPGTSLNVVKKILDKSKISYYYSHVPERAIPGNTLYELVNNDRIIGSADEVSGKLTANLYSCFVKGKIFVTDLITAEVTKLLENSYRDVNIAFANSILKIADQLKFDAFKAIEFANRHPRVNILKPGPGVGGHCIPIDPWFLVENATEKGLIEVSRKINDGMPNFWVQKLKHRVEESGISAINIGIFGLSYKPNVDDVRESPALEIIKLLKEENFNVRISDPFVNSKIFNIEPAEDVYSWSDITMIVTMHSEYDSFKNRSKILNCNG